MLRHVESSLAVEGVEFLQVKTLSARAIPTGDMRGRGRLLLLIGVSAIRIVPDAVESTEPALQMVKVVERATNS
jgi:hypothetical protein